MFLRAMQINLFRIFETNLFYTSKSEKNLNKLINRDMKHLNNWLNANKISF